MGRRRKRGYGEGSVYFETATGRYRGAVGGRRVSARSYDEALAKLDELRAQLAAGPAWESPDTKLGDWIDWWLENVNRAKSARTADHNRWALDQLDQIRKKRLRDVEVADVESELNRLCNRTAPKVRGRGSHKGPLGKSSLVKVRRALAEVLTEAERRNKVHKNVAKLAHIPVDAAPPVERRALSPEEASRLMAVAGKADGARYQAMVVVMLYCGLRPGEVAGLPWTALNLGEGTLTVLQSRKVLPDGTMEIGATKAHSDRVLQLPSPVQEALRAHQARQAADRATAPVWEDHGLVFCNEIGRPFDPSNLRRVIERLCKKAEIEQISPYEMRHTAATLLVASGMRLEDVADFMGHVDTTMLVATYRHKAKRVVNLTAGQEQMFSS
jgi:integrase